MILSGPDGERLVPIGELVGVHGVRGESRLRPFNPDSAVLANVDDVFLVRGGIARRHALEHARPHARVWLLAIEGVDSIGAADALRGATVAVRESDLPALEPGEFYWYQLVGLEVVDTSGRPLGAVSEIVSTPGSDVLVAVHDGKECMIPMVDSMVVRVDLDRRQIVVEPVDGLVG